MRAAVPHVVAGATPYRHGGCPMTTIPSASAGSSLLAPEGAAVGRPALEDHAPRGGENDQQQEDDPDPVEPGKTLIAGPWRAASGGRLAHRLPLSAPRARSCPAEGLARAYPRWWSGGGETQRRPHVGVDAIIVLPRMGATGLEPVTPPSLSIGDAAWSGASACKRSPLSPARTRAHVRPDRVPTPSARRSR